MSNIFKKNPAAAASSQRLIGNWGIYLIFQVGLEKAFTFTNAKRQIGSRYAEHSLIGNVPRLEWLGPQITQITMEIFLSVDQGVYVQNAIKTIERAVRTGVANDLWIGGKRIGTNKFIIESVNEDWLRHFYDGQLTHARNSLTFREYYEGPK